MEGTQHRLHSSGRSTFTPRHSPAAADKCVACYNSLVLRQMDKNKDVEKSDLRLMHYYLQYVLYSLTSPLWT